MNKDSRVIAAILAADVVEYSRLMAADEPGTLAALKSRRALFDDQVGQFGGREFGSVGDSLMAEFHSAVNAVSAALAIQERVAVENAGLPRERRMLLRIGVTLGDVIEEPSGVFGDAVNVAARLQAIAKPGGVLISGPVYDQVHAKVAARYVDAGTRQVKNISEPVRTYEVLPAAPLGIVGRVGAALSSHASRRILRGALIGIAIGIALGLGLFWRKIPVPTTDSTLGSLLDPGSAQLMPNSLAVLPFPNVTGDASNDYLGDGLADELQHRLSRVPGLSVAARRSSFAYKGKDMDVRKIAEALGVAYIVEGSIRRQGDTVRVIATLVDGATGANRWSESYESTGDFFKIEDDIGTKVLANLERVLGIGPEPAASQPRAGGVAAYDLYLQGLYYLRQPRSAKSLAAAEDLFRRALTENKGFARAEAGLCQAYVERFSLERDPARVAEAEAACERARLLDPDAQEVHEAIGRLRIATGDAAEAESAFRRALALVPASPDALIGLASALAASDRIEGAESTYQQAIAAQPRYGASHTAYGKFLYSRGRSQEAIAAYEQGTILMPDNPDAFSNLGVAYLMAGDFDRGGRALKRALEIEPRRGGYTNYGSLLYYQGRYADAEQQFRRALETAPADHRLWGNLADAMRFDGKPGEASDTYRRALELAEGELAVNPKSSVNQAQAAYYSIQLGDRDRARKGIAAALPEGDDDPYVHYYVALTQLGLGDMSDADSHLQRAKILGLPEVILKSAPELGNLRITR